MRSGLRIWYRIVRSEPALVLTALVMIALTTVVAAGGIGLFDRVSSDDLHQALAFSEPEQRSIRVELDTRLGAGAVDAPFHQVERRGQLFFEEELTDVVQSVVDGQEWVAQSPPFRVSSFPESEDGPFTRTLRFRYQSGIEEQMTVVQGRLPQAREPRPLLLGPACPADITAVDGFEETEDVACALVEVPVYEVAMTVETATDLMIEFGETIFLRPEPIHPRWAFISLDRLNDRIVVEVSGIVELSNLSDPYWFGDDTLHRPAITENPDFRFIFASAIMHDRSYRQMLRDVPEVHFDYTWRYLVDQDRVVPADAAQLAVDVDKLGSSQGQVLSELPTLIGTHLRQRSLATSLLSIVLAGFLTASAAGTFVLASLSARRRIDSMRLLLNRGVKRRSIQAAGLWHGLVIAVPAVVIGLMLSWLLEPDAALPSAAAVAAVIGLGAVATTMWAVRAAIAVAADGTVASPQFAGRTGTVDDWFSTRLQTTGVRRLVRDATVVVLAGAAAMVIRQRGNIGAVEVGQSGSIADDLDALLTVMAPLVGLAFGVVLLRLAGPIYRLLTVGQSRTRGTVRFVGLRRLINQDRSTRAAMVVVVVAVGIAGLAATVERTIVDGQTRHGWQSAAADLVVRGHTDGVPIPPLVDELVRREAVTVADGIERPATAVVEPLGAPPVHLVAIDPVKMAELLGHGPFDIDQVGRIASPTGSTALAGVVSGRFDGGFRPAVGSVVELQVGTSRLGVEVVGEVATFPSTPVDQPVVIVDIAQLQQTLGIAAPPLTTLFAEPGPGIDPSLLAESIIEFDPSARVVARQSVLDSIREDPFIRWSVIGLRLTGWLSWAAGAVAMLSALAITAPGRQRNIGLLTIVGIRPRQAAALSAIEQIVPYALAGAAGVGLGLGLVRLLRPLVDLEPFAGALLPIEIATDPMAVIAPAALLVGTAVVAVLAGITMRFRPGAKTRTPTTLSMGGPS